MLNAGRQAHRVLLVLVKLQCPPAAQERAEQFKTILFPIEEQAEF